MTERTPLAASASAALALALALAACGERDRAGAGSGDRPRALAAGHVAAVNAALPAALRGTLELEAGRVVESTKRGGYLAAVPKGWKAGALPGSLVPPDADGFGSKTLGRSRLSIGSNCDGECVPKDWAAASDKALFAQFTSGRIPGKVTKDERRPTGRTLVFEREAGPLPDQEVAIYIHVAWWTAESPRYHACSVELGAPLRGAAAAFEQACAGVVEQ
jgi:hypothetical protein